MPNSRHRRFSVCNGIAGREPCKIQNGLQTSSTDPDPETKTANKNQLSMKSNKSKSKLNANNSKATKNATSNTTVTDYGISSISINSLKSPKVRANTADKDVTADSSTIDLFNIMNSTENVAEPSTETIESNDNSHGRFSRQVPRERTPLRRDKRRQHRIKVRSPKRRAVHIDTQNKTNDNKPNDMSDNRVNKREIDCKIINEKGIDFKIITKNSATEPIDWTQKMVACSPSVRRNVVESNEEDEEMQSDHSFDDMCRICHGGDGLSPELGQLISACSCRGTVGRVHVKCLERWLTESGKSRCELCGTRYVTRRVHRYGVPRALVMWILSQNAKQLMVDSLGIMLMSPLAVLAAWLSGRTLAGLMTQDSNATPWPLASTFVLACMTLVCYYCWIVSAATRHALSWWIWYRSQYEVRLQLNGEE